MNSFIGNQPATSFESPKKQVSTSNSGTTITLDYPVTSVADIRLTINAVVQSYDNYSVSGSTLTVGGTLNNDRVEILFVGRTYGSIVPSDASVGLNQLSATGTPSSSNFLRGDNSWASAGVSGIDSSADATAITIDSSENVSMSQNLSFNSGFGSATTVFGCRAWVNFNGTGTLAVRNSGNVSSVTDNTTGSYTVNFSTNMPDVNFVGVDGGGMIESTANQQFNKVAMSLPDNVGNHDIETRLIDNDAPSVAQSDLNIVQVAYFR